MFDRMISTCLFRLLRKHIEAFQGLRKETKIGGKILDSNNPEILCRTLRAVTTLAEAIKQGLD